MRISPIQQAQNKTTRPSFQRLKGVKFVKNTVFEDGKNFVLKSNKFFDKNEGRTKKGAAFRNTLIVTIATIVKMAVKIKASPNPCLAENAFT